MTEAEWMACEDPTLMLEFLRAKVTDRKLRLFACACCRRVWSSIEDERSQTAVLVAELYLDGAASDAELLTAANAANYASYLPPTMSNSVQHACNAAHLTTYAGSTIEAFIVAPLSVRPTYAGYAAEALRNPVAYASLTAVCVAHAVLSQGEAEHGYHNIDPILGKEYSEQCQLLRDIIGPLPFRPVTIDDSVFAWNAGTVVNLARAVYEDRGFDRMPILADAFEDAGCHDEDIIRHCRERREHVGGCWVVDLLLQRG